MQWIYLTKPASINPTKGNVNHEQAKQPPAKNAPFDWDSMHPVRLPHGQPTRSTIELNC